MVGITAFMISRGVADRLRDMRDLQKTTLAETVARCIAAGHLLHRETDAKRLVFAGDEPLDIPEAKMIWDPLDIPFGTYIHPKSKKALRDIGLKFVLDRNSSLGWCIECYDLINELRVTNQIYSRGPGGTRYFRPLWDL